MYHRSRVLKKLSQIESLINGEKPRSEINRKVFNLLDEVRHETSKIDSREDENLKKLIFEKAPIGILHFNKDGVITACNSHFVNIIGSSRDKLMGLNLNELPNRELVATFHNVLKGEGGIFEGKYETITSHKTIFVRAIFQPIEPSGGIGIISDMTNEIEAVKKLERTEQKLRDVVEYSTSMFFTHDVEGYLKYVSPQAREILGVGQEEALRNWTDFITGHPENKKAKKHTANAIETGEAQPSYRLQVERPDGSKRWVIVNEAPIIKNNEVVGVTGSISDITEQVKAQEASERHWKLLDELTNQTSAAVWARDSESKFIFTNEEYKRLFSVKGKNLLDKKVDELFDRERAAQFKRNDQIVLKTNKQFIFETWLKIDEEYRYFRINMFPLHDIPGIDNCIGGVALDITDQKKHEGVIKESLQEKEILLAEVHHRVKNNLAVISGLLELSASQTEDDKLTSLIQSSQLRIQSMAKVHELLYESEFFSKIPFKDYINSLLDTIQLTIDTSGFKPNFITYIEQIPLNINYAIPCGMLVNELITNSIKHAFPNSQTGTITINFYKEANRVILQVKDRGIGIEDDFDAASSSSLGMTLIRILSQQLDAELNMENTNVGFQTTVSFYLEDAAKGSAANL